MEDSRYRNTAEPFQPSSKPFTDEMANAFLRNVFTNMAIGLALTGLTAWLVFQTPALWQFFIQNKIVFYITLFAPLALVFFLSARVHKMSLGQATAAFGSYAILNGITLSVIFAVYSMGSIANTFFITAGTFISMALLGYTTKIDLSKYSSILYMALIGLIISMVVNFFLQSDTFDYIISGVGVLIFSGLTAYDTQKMLRIGASVDPEEDSSKKIALIGALQLYLDFINLFLFLLRFFGGRD